MKIKKYRRRKLPKLPVIPKCSCGNYISKQRVKNEIYNCPSCDPTIECCGMQHPAWYSYCPECGEYIHQAQLKKVNLT